MYILSSSFLIPFIVAGALSAPLSNNDEVTVIPSSSGEHFPALPSATIIQPSPVLPPKSIPTSPPVKREGEIVQTTSVVIFTTLQNAFETLLGSTTVTFNVFVTDVPFANGPPTFGELTVPSQGGTFDSFITVDGDGDDDSEGAGEASSANGASTQPTQASSNAGTAASTEEDTAAQSSNGKASSGSTISPSVVATKSVDTVQSVQASQASAPAKTVESTSNKSTKSVDTVQNVQTSQASASAKAAGAAAKTINKSNKSTKSTKASSGATSGETVVPRVLSAKFKPLARSLFPSIFNIDSEYGFDTFDAPSEFNHGKGAHVALRPPSQGNGGPFQFPPSNQGKGQGNGGSFSQGQSGPFPPPQGGFGGGGSFNQGNNGHGNNGNNNNNNNGNDNEDSSGNNGSNSDNTSDKRRETGAGGLEESGDSRLDRRLTLPPGIGLVRISGGSFSNGLSAPQKNPF